MGIAIKKADLRHRELRRRVVLPARMRSGARWSDTCILNISSRGLLIHSATPTAEGSTVELWRGEQVIVATVVWRDGARVGLRTNDRLPVELILSLSQSKSLQLIASNGTRVERRKRPRFARPDARLRGRAIEFIGVAAIAICLAIGASGVVEAALAKPLSLAAAALPG